MHDRIPVLRFYSNELLVVRNQSIDGFIHRRSDKTKSHFLSFEYQKHQDAHNRSRFYPIISLDKCRSYVSAVLEKCDPAILDREELMQNQPST